MKKTILVICFLTALFYSQSALAQVAVEEVVIRGNAQWKPWQGGGGGTGGVSGYEPSEKDLERFETKPKLLRTYTKVTKSGRRFQVSEFDDNGEWVIAAKEIKQADQPYRSMNPSQIFDSFESFAAHAKSVTWCREWLESEEQKLGLTGTVKGEAGTPLVKGGLGVGAEKSKTNTKQTKNTQCATMEF